MSQHNLVFVVGIGLLVISLLAYVNGNGDDPGFGNQQMIETIAGVVILVFGFVLTLRGK
jgi:hypothetical protein